MVRSNKTLIGMDGSFHGTVTIHSVFFGWSVNIESKFAMIEWSSKRNDIMRPGRVSLYPNVNAAHGQS